MPAFHASCPRLNPDVMPAAKLDTECQFSASALPIIKDWTGWYIIDATGHTWISPPRRCALLMREEYEVGAGSRAVRSSSIVR